ncbi:CHAT domain-containing protein, partial [Vararia minispora EC-137]
LIALGYSLESRLRRLGKLVDIHDAIDAGRSAILFTPDNDPEKLYRLSGLAHYLTLRFNALEEISDIEEAVETHRHVVKATLDDHPDKPARLNNLGSSLERRFSRLDNLPDIEEAVDAARRAVDLARSGDPEEPIFLSNLGSFLSTRFDRTQELSDIENAIAVQRRVADMTPDSHPSKPIRLSNLANSFDSRFKRLDNLSDIESAVSTSRRAYELTPDDHPGKLERLSSFAIYLVARFDRTQDLKDVEEAIKAHRRVVDSTPDDDPTKPLRLSQLGLALRSRFSRIENLNDLEEAISAVRQAAILTPDDHPGKLYFLSSLGVYFNLRFDKLHDPSDIEEAVKTLRLVIDLTPDDHPVKPARLNSLGFALESRFKRFSNPVDIEDAISAARRATELTPDDHPDVHDRLGNLGYYLNLRFDALKTRADIDEAISIYSRVVDLSPDNHPNKSIRLMGLARSLDSRFEQYSDAFDFSGAFQAYLRAAALGSGPPSVRLQAAMMCARLCRQDRTLGTDNRQLEAYKHALPLIPQVAWLGHDVDRRFDELSTLGDIASGAAAVAISAGQYALAIEWLEEGRSVVWGQLLRLRTPLDELRARHPALADDLQRVSRALHNAGSPRPNPDSKTDRSSEDRTVMHRELAEQYSKIIADIRTKPDFHRFLLPKKLAELSPAQGTAGPVVIINVHRTRCDALILNFFDHIAHVPLPELSYATTEDMRSRLVKALRRASVRDRGALSCLPRAGYDQTLPWVLDRLWRFVVEPVLKNIETKDTGREELPHVTWCPTGPLSFLPLHAAGLYHAGRKGSEQPSRIFNHVVSSYTTTLSALSRSHSAPMSQINILVVSQPKTPGFGALPGTSEEVERIKCYFSQEQLVHLEDSAATVKTVLDAMDARSPRMLHLACHGVQDSARPTDSAFMLYDGPLSLSALMTKTTEGAELAFLSACQTATGDEKLAEEAVHLAAGMLAVGYRAVIGTMWSIGDADAPLIADEVYARLGGKKRSVALALHDAVGRLREEVGEQNFLRWIPFVHFG